MEMFYKTEKGKMLPESVCTIGVFDGVHAGHQHLIRMVLQQARQQGLASMVVTFDRMPQQVFDRQFCPQLLTTVEEKKAILENMGIDHVVVLPFTKELAGLSAREFMKSILHDQFRVKVLVIGYDNRFGHNRAEGFEDYVRYGHEMDMQVLRGDTEMMADGNKAVSSSEIRLLLSEKGRVDMMPQCLTRPYLFSGKVMSGEHIGHQLGFPTANLEPLSKEKLIPAPGVYAVWATLEDGKELAAMMNIGTRPTFEGKRQTLEVNILDFDGNLYGQTVTISFVARLREERKFESPEALVAQLKEDQDNVIKLLNTIRQ